MKKQLRFFFSIKWSVNRFIKKLKQFKKNKLFDSNGRVLEVFSDFRVFTGWYYFEYFPLFVKSSLPGTIT